MMKPGKQKIGFIGLGVMGQSMAGHILAAGYDLQVYTRTPKKAKGLMEKGALWQESVADLSSACSVIITIVGFPDDVEQVYLGEGGILSAASPGTLTIDMTTSSPALARRIYDAGKTKGIDCLDAPVSGGDIGARNAALSIMAGGERTAFDRALPLLSVMGSNIVYQGEAGSGQHTKMANQIAISAGMVAVCEALAYAKKAGLDPAQVLESIAKGAAGSWSLTNLGPKMLKNDYTPGFFIKHFIKDLDIAKNASKAFDMDTPGLDMTLSLYRKLAKKKGYEEKGTQALFDLYQ